MKNIFPLITLLTIFIACTQPKNQLAQQALNLDSIKQVLKQTDQAFSDLSKTKGRNASFLTYMDDHVTMLRPNGMPLVGKDTMTKRFATRPDTSYTLTWSPLFADAAASGGLGYTYGTWLLVTSKNDSSEGTYCSIWKKDSVGNWKFVLDTGNEGLKPLEEKK
ncbi:MAG: YybH family protein [Chitinophagales bacterium]